MCAKWCDHWTSILLGWARTSAPSSSLSEDCTLLAKIPLPLDGTDTPSRATTTTTPMTLAANPFVRRHLTGDVSEGTCADLEVLSTALLCARMHPTSMTSSGTLTMK